MNRLSMLYIADRHIDNFYGIYDNRLTSAWTRLETKKANGDIEPLASAVTRAEALKAKGNTLYVCGTDLSRPR